MNTLKRNVQTDKVIHLLTEIQFLPFGSIALGELRVNGNLHRRKAPVTGHCNRPEDFRTDFRRKTSHNDFSLNADVSFQDVLIAKGFKELFPNMSLEVVHSGAENAKVYYKGLQI